MEGTVCIVVRGVLYSVEADDSIAGYLEKMAKD